MNPTLTTLQSQFPLGNLARFEEGPGGLGRIVIAARHARAVVYLHGAHVAEYEPAGQEPVLFMSRQSLFDPARPIRGGVPVIFPWFGPRGGDPSAPLHGFVRTQPWAVEDLAEDPAGNVVLVLSLADTEATRAVWPHPFALRFTVTVGTALTMSLAVRNPSAAPINFEEALHTYFRVGDVRRIAIHGLSGVDFLDKTEGMKRKTQGPSPVQITGETDRVYLNTAAACTIDDRASQRRIVIEKSGSNATVVWNPWIAKAKALPDFGDDEWSEMVCIETVNALENAITLPPGQTHSMTARIRLET